MQHCPKLEKHLMTDIHELSCPYHIHPPWNHTHLLSQHPCDRGFRNISDRECLRIYFLVIPAENPQQKILSCVIFLLQLFVRGIPGVGELGPGGRRCLEAASGRYKWWQRDVFHVWVSWTSLRRGGETTARSSLSSLGAREADFMNFWLSWASF